MSGETGIHGTKTKTSHHVFLLGLTSDTCGFMDCNFRWEVTQRDESSITTDLADKSPYVFKSRLVV